MFSYNISIRKWFEQKKTKCMVWRHWQRQIHCLILFTSWTQRIRCCCFCYLLISVWRNRLTQMNFIKPFASIIVITVAVVATLKLRVEITNLSPSLITHVKEQFKQSAIWHHDFLLIFNPRAIVKIDI